MRKVQVVILALLSVALLASHAFAEPFLPQWDWIKEPLLGKIKAMTYKGDNIVRVTHFSEQGRVVRDDVLDEKGVLQYRAEPSYDKDGVMETVSIFDGKGKRLYVETAYIKNGKIVFLERSGEWKKARFVYDDKGRLTQIITVRQSRDDGEKWVYAYDDKGRMIEEYRVNMSGVKHSRRTMTYNEKDLVKDKDLYTLDDRVYENRHYTYEYDKLGNWIKKKLMVVGHLDNEGKAIDKYSSREIEYY